jgi:IS1 family transposase
LPHRADTVTLDVHRFEESIAGRVYLIEVKNVATDRWRAYIVRLPGVPTALMPFYGRTPVEAAEHLCEWLTRAYARAANPVGTV